MKLEEGTAIIKHHPDRDPATYLSTPKTYKVTTQEVCL